jgi:hypothetical protein
MHHVVRLSAVLRPVRQLPQQAIVLEGIYDVSKGLNFACGTRAAYAVAKWAEVHGAKFGIIGLREDRAGLEKFVSDSEVLVVVVKRLHLQILPS